MIGFNEYKKLLLLAGIFMAGMFPGYLIHKGIDKARKKTNDEMLWEKCGHKSYYVTSTWAKCGDDGGKPCEVKEGDRFRVLDKCEGVLLIDIIGDDNNPYLVTEDFAKEVSTYSDKQAPVMRRFLDYMGINDNYKEKGSRED